MAMILGVALVLATVTVYTQSAFAASANGGPTGAATGGAATSNGGTGGANGGVVDVCLSCIGTSHDLTSLRTGIHSDISALRANLASEISALRANLDHVGSGPTGGAVGDAVANPAFGGR